MRTLTGDKWTLDELIDIAAEVDPGRDAWNPIFKAFPKITGRELAKRFRERGNQIDEADQDAWLEHADALDAIS